jgi:hypothetical protein
VAILPLQKLPPWGWFDDNPQYHFAIK